MEQAVQVVVEAGKATAAPPLGPALGPLGVNIKKIIDEINEKTMDLAGLRVPVKVIVDTKSKAFRIEIGKPPASQLVLKELKIPKGSSMAGKDRAGDLTEEQVKRIARAKLGSDDKSSVNQIKGTCRSMGITIGKGAVTEEELKEAKKHKQAAKDGAAAKKTEAAEAPAAEAK